MRHRSALVTAVVAAALVVAACTEDRNAPHPAAPVPSAGSPTEAAAAPVRPPPTDERSYPFTYVDVDRAPVSTVSDTGAKGPPPRIPWTEPTWTTTIVHSGGPSLRLPRWGFLGGTVGDDVVLDGGCTRGADRCGSRPHGGVHLLDPRGAVRSIDPLTQPHRVRGVVDSVNGDEVAWLADHAAGTSLFRLSTGDAAPTELPVPRSGGARGTALTVGFVGPGDVLLHHRGRQDYYTRSSGRPAPWNARWLSAVAPGTLVGEPGFTPPRERCLSLFTADTRRPRWTRCYRSGGRPAYGFDEVTMAAGGESLVTRDLFDVVLVDARTGLPTNRLRFDDRVQDVAFEDRDHVLVLLDAADAAADEWPLQRIVRCSLDLRCEPTTSPIRITAYDSLWLVPPGSGGE